MFVPLLGFHSSADLLHLRLAFTLLLFRLVANSLLVAGLLVSGPLRLLLLFFLVRLFPLVSVPGHFLFSLALGLLDFVLPLLLGLQLRLCLCFLFLGFLKLCLKLRLFLVVGGNLVCSTWPTIHVLFKFLLFLRTFLTILVPDSPCLFDSLVSHVSTS